MAAGEFCYTLTATNIATGWTINRSVRNKAAEWVFEALEYVIARFPFSILGIDSDKRFRVHQSPPVRPLPNQQDHLHPLQSRQQQRRRPCRAEELVTRQNPRRLPPLRQRRRVGSTQRHLGTRRQVHQLLVGPAKLVSKRRTDRKRSNATTGNNASLAARYVPHRLRIGDRRSRSTAH